MSDLAISVRADLFRVAQAYCDARQLATCGVRVEPLQRGRGVVLVALDGFDLIAIPDPTGESSRAATIRSPGALTKMAVDLFRRDGVAVRLKVDGDLAFIEPEAGGTAARDVEVKTGPLDWRGELARHAHKSLEPPFVGDARATRRLVDTATVLARAAGCEDPIYELKGGVDGAVLATFPS